MKTSGRISKDPGRPRGYLCKLLCCVIRGLRSFCFVLLFQYHNRVKPVANTVRSRTGVHKSRF